MRILVGVMYCIENEFQECLSAIRNQTHQDFEIFIVENLPNKLAHDTLYSTFMKRNKEFDLFIKIDADMVLSRNTFFEEVIEVFSQDVHNNHYEILVDDFYTKKWVWGLHIYKNDVKWVKNDQKYTVDIVHGPTQKRNFVNKEDGLVPAAFHCPNPSEFQSFHFGIHRAVKAMQIGASKSNYRSSSAREQFNVIKQIIRLYKVDKNRMRGLALFGALIAIDKRMDNNWVDFQSERTLEVYKSLKKKELSTEIRSLLNNYKRVFNKDFEFFRDYIESERLLVINYYLRSLNYLVERIKRKISNLLFN